MKLRTLGYLLFCSVLFFSAGCLGKKAPNTSPKKPKAQKAEVLNQYLLVPGCDGGKKIKDVPGPLKDYRDKMFERNMRFMDSHGRKGEEKIFRQCDSVEAIDRFFAQFWGLTRDPDTTTPVNEYKELIDERILDIENEVFFNDNNIPGTTFAANGGLRGDMAHVYLLRGAPHYVTRFENPHLISEMIAWVYFDPVGRPLMVFIFYNKGNGFRVFRNHMTMNTQDAFLQVLREIARVYPTSQQDFESIYRELLMNDREYIFQYGLARFSYDDQVRIDKVLAAPTPEAITAKPLQPRILGVPEIPKDMKLVFSRYNATITGFFTLNKDLRGDYRGKLTLPLLDLDWEKKEILKEDGSAKEVYESKFDVLISFTNEETREKKEYSFVMSLSIPGEKYEASKGTYFPISLDNLTNNSGGKDGNMSIPDIVKSLKPGNYEVKLNLWNNQKFSLKSGLWLKYITVQ